MIQPIAQISSACKQRQRACTELRGNVILRFNNVPPIDNVALTTYPSVELVGAFPQRLGRHEGRRARTSGQQQIVAAELVTHAEIRDLRDDVSTRDFRSVHSSTCKLQQCHSVYDIQHQVHAPIKCHRRTCTCTCNNWRHILLKLCVTVCKLIRQMISHCKQTNKQKQTVNNAEE